MAKKVARRVYSFQAREAPGCGKVKGVPAHGWGYYREETLGIKDWGYLINLSHEFWIYSETNSGKVVVKEEES